MKQILIKTCEDCPYLEYAYSTDQTPFVCEHIDMDRDGIKDCKKIQEWCPLEDRVDLTS